MKVYRPLNFNFLYIISFLCILNYGVYASPHDSLVRIEKILDNPSKDAFLIASELRSALEQSISLKQANEIVKAYRKKDSHEFWKTLIPSDGIDTREKSHSFSSDATSFSTALDSAASYDAFDHGRSRSSTLSSIKTSADSEARASEQEENPTPYGQELPLLKPKPDQYLLLKKVRRLKYRKIAEHDYMRLPNLSPEDSIKPTEFYFLPHHKTSSVRLTEDTITRWIKKEKLVNSALLSSPDCLKFNEIKKRDFPGQIFQVYYKPSCLARYKVEKLKQGVTKAAYREENKLLFVIKELELGKGLEEISNLQKVQYSPELRKLENIRNPDNLQLTFAEEFYTYRDARGEQRIIILLLPAKGTNIYTLIKENSSFSEEALRKFSQTLATFHKKFMKDKDCLLIGGSDLKACKTIIHGDLNPYNAFYSRPFVYWIDLETMANSLRSRKLFSIDCGDFFAFLSTKTQNIKGNLDKIKSIFLKTYAETISSDPSIQAQVQKMIVEAAQRSPYSLAF